MSWTDQWFSCLYAIIWFQKTWKLAHTDHFYDALTLKIFEFVIINSILLHGKEQLAHYSKFLLSTFRCILFKCIETKKRAV